MSRVRNRLALGIYLIGALSQLSNGKEAGFLVRGTVDHQQFGKHPRQTIYQFVARSHSCNWSVSAAAQPRDQFDQVFAVGNEQGIFVTMDMSSMVVERQRGGQPVGINNTQAVVLTNGVPSCLFAPALGPIWLTYLSGCYLKSSTSQTITVPVPLNVAGGSCVPLFGNYRQRSAWRSNNETDLPDEFTSMDDGGYLKGIVSDQLVRISPYPPPFSKGFTNIHFRVLEYQQSSFGALPKAATLEVFWVYMNRLEKIHRFELTATSVEPEPATPLPEPTPMGIAAVTDARISTTNGPVIIEYMATNRFLEPSELKELPSYRQAIRDSLELQPPLRISNYSRVLFWITIAAIALGIGIPSLLSTRKPKINTQTSANIYEKRPNIAP